MIDLNTFQRHADTYGGDLSRWPKELLPAAVTTLKTHQDAQAILDDALAFDMELAAMPVPAIDYALRAKILEIPQQNAMPAALRWLMTPTRIAAGLALFGLLGLSAGIANGPFPSSEEEEKAAWIFAPEQSVEYDYAMLD